MFYRNIYSMRFIVLLMFLLVPGSWSSWFSTATTQCDEEQIPLNITDFKMSMEKLLFGQPLAMELVYILDGYKKSHHSGTRKGLGLSFHGLQGTGKTYVASLIAAALFKGGLKSPLVKVYNSGAEFPHTKDIIHYKDKLWNEIHNLVKQCGIALIVFEEVNDMPPGVLDVIKPMLDYHGEINGVDFSKTIFIFISNLGGDDIMWHFYDMDIPREELEFNDFNSILRKSLDEALELDNNGFLLIKAEVIDHYIPFLPLEVEHVKKCIKTEFQIQGVKTVTDELIEKVMSNLLFIDATKEDLYIQSGCKMIMSQVTFYKSKMEL